MQILADAAQGAENNMFSMITMMGLAIVFFYFILLRPEQKRKQKLQDLRSSLKKGDQVTAMGIVATVEDIKEDTVILKQVDGHHIEMLKAAISDIKLPEGKETA